ncbi:MAG TPA: GSCFA domain-containing protein, partial [Caulobacteraceae bacterium]|nr:GSCFA domain-containing protein [Caulobacteraceae bacterium]
MSDQLSGAGAASLVMSYAEAKRHKSSSRSRWRDVAGELESELWPEVQPSFRLHAGETAFTIGSCFARSIEANLAALGCKVPMLDLRLPGEEWDGEANGAMNKFHPPAFRQCLEWVARVHDRDGVVAWEDCEAIAFDLGDGRFQDLDMAQAVAPVDQARFIQRRQEIFDIFKSAFTADCLMMTPGLIEAWKDLDTGLYAFGAPWGRQQLATPERWQLEVLSFQRCLEDMLAAIDVVRARNPAVKILVTTSPVPLTRTFTGQDISIANSYSKSVLRAVCGAVLLERQGVDYFPSYEMATLSNPSLVWKVDRIHVSPAFVGKIVGHMLDHYMEGVEPAAVHYQRARALMLGRAYGEAETAAREALAARADHIEARIVLGTALSLLRRWGEAEPELRLALEADPERNDARVHLAHAVAYSGRTGEAVDLVDAAMDRSSFTAVD